MKEKPLKRLSENALRLRKLSAWQRRLLKKQNKKDWKLRRPNAKELKLKSKLNGKD